MKKRGTWIVLAISVILIILILITNFHSEKNILKVTNEHPFLIDGKWVVANNLNIGDELSLVNGKRARITNIKDIKENVEVYNLEAGAYNDFVLMNGIVVHNSNRPTIERWDSNPVNLELINEFEGGRREGAKLYKVTLGSGEERLVSVKEIDIKDLQSDIYKLGPQLSGFPGDKMNYYLTENEIVKELQSQIERLEKVNPNWGPFYSTEEIVNGKRKFIIYSDAYVPSNPNWVGGEWTSFSKLSEGSAYESFIRDIANSDSQVRNKFIDQLMQLKEETGTGIDRTIAISDGNKDNVMIWIKRDGNRLADLEVRPIDTYDPTSLYPDYTRKAQLKWVDDLIKAITK